eukprot:COSAG05_NODE_1269_length_5318_cov_3.679824_3_plen_216_part_00
MHSPLLGYGLQLGSFNGLYTLLPPASADAFPVWQKQPAAQEEAPNSEERPQQRFLYLNEARQQWYFNSENTPDKGAHWAVEKRVAGLRPLPMGAGMAWKVFTGVVGGEQQWKEMSLTLQQAVDPVQALQRKYPELREVAALVRLGLTAADTVRRYGSLSLSRSLALSLSPCVHACTTVVVIWCVCYILRFRNHAQLVCTYILSTLIDSLYQGAAV